MQRGRKLRSDEVLDVCRQSGQHRNNQGPKANSHSAHLEVNVVAAQDKECDVNRLRRVRLSEAKQSLLGKETWAADATYASWRVVFESSACSAR